MTSLLRLDRQQKSFLKCTLNLYITLSFYVYFELKRKIRSYTAVPDSRLNWGKVNTRFQTETTPNHTLWGGLYTQFNKGCFGLIGHWRLGIGHLSIHNNPIICLSDHQTIDSQCGITIASSNVNLISCIKEYPRISNECFGFIRKGTQYRRPYK